MGWEREGQTPDTGLMDDYLTGLSLSFQEAKNAVIKPCVEH